MDKEGQSTSVTLLSAVDTCSFAFPIAFNVDSEPCNLCKHVVKLFLVSIDQFLDLSLFLPTLFLPLLVELLLLLAFLLASLLLFHHLTATVGSLLFYLFGSKFFPLLLAIQ